MSKKLSPFLPGDMRRMPLAVAKAVGLKVYSTRRKKQFESQMSRVKSEIIGATDFPKPEKHGKALMLPRAAVMTWAAGHFEVSKDKRSFTISTELLNKKGIGEIPAAEKPAQEDQQFLELSPEEMLKNRLKFNLDIYLNPQLHRNPQTGAVQRLTIDEKKELRDAGLLPKYERLENGDSSPDDFIFPNFTTNLTTLASYYKKRFEPLAGRQFSCNKQTIKNWQAGKGIPRNKEWHPAADAGGRFWLFTNQNCFKWFEETMLPVFKRPISSPELGSFDSNMPLRDILEERERIERKEILLRDSEIERALGNLMEVGVAQSVFKGFALRVDAAMDQFVTARNGLREVVARIIAEIFTPDASKLTQLDDRLAKELALAYDGLKLKFADAQMEQQKQIEELSKPVLNAKN